MDIEHEATARLRVENHGKRDYFYAGDEYVGEVNKVSFNFGHDTGEVFARIVNAHDDMLTALEAVMEDHNLRQISMLTDLKLVVAAAIAKGKAK